MKIVKCFNDNITNEDKETLNGIINNFDSYEGGFGERNVIKTIPFKGFEINIKAFKIPNLINQIAYSFFRKSKARRSYEYANILLDKGVKTPEPIAYFEFYKGLFFKKSFYISKQTKYNLTFRELIEIPDYPNHESILRAFTRFTFSLHEKEVNFLDHSPGNTLIVTNNEDCQFYLVDLNRMKFESMDFNARMKNFGRLSPKGPMLEVMADEYSKLYTLNSKKEILELMYAYYEKFTAYFTRKDQFKKRYFFWRKKKR